MGFLNGGVLKGDSMKKGFTCNCGKFNAFTGYVFAHWNELLVFTCSCGTEYNVFSGVAYENKIK